MTLLEDEARLREDPGACLIRPRLVYHNGLTLTRHRELWLREVGPLGKKRLVRRGDAPCWFDISWCANPYHFEPVPGTVKARGRKPYVPTGRPDAAAINRAKTECPKQHPLTPENVYTWIDSKGRLHRKCRRCTIRLAEKQRSKR